VWFITTEPSGAIMSTVISTTIDIDASPREVWEVLTDFAAYGEWNPFMDRIEGTPSVGSKLRVHMTPPNGRAVTFKPKVLVATPERELRWLGRLGFGGLFDGEHFFVLGANADGSTRVTNGEAFSGILVAAMKGTLRNTDAGFAAFNGSLKERVEAARARRT
jgi:hypothetical protein